MRWKHAERNFGEDKEKFVLNVMKAIKKVNKMFCLVDLKKKII